MDKKNIQIIGLVVGAIILVYLLFGQFFGKKGSSGGVGGGVSGGEVGQIFSSFDGYVRLLADKEINDSLERVMQEKLQEGWERNPFEILVSTNIEKEIVMTPEQGGINPDEPAFSITGIVFDRSPVESSVIIDGEFYRIGDTIEGWTIVQVDVESVSFRSGDVEYIYTLYTAEDAVY